MDGFVVTPNMIESDRCKTYIPLMEKLAFVADAAQNCFERVEITLDGEEKSPPHYKENTGIKSRYLMGALVGMYLGQEIDPLEGTKWLMAADDYDRWARNHIFNQLERLKTKGPNIREKVFDLLADYRDLEKRMNTEVYSLLQVMNDPVHRFALQLQRSFTPEYAENAMSELKKLQGELSNLAKKHEEGEVDQ